MCRLTIESTAGILAVYQGQNFQRCKGKTLNNFPTCEHFVKGINPHIHRYSRDVSGYQHAVYQATSGVGPGYHIEI